MQRKNRVLLRKIIFAWSMVLACRVAGAETLDYRLAYRGLLTLFLWKELADVRLVTKADDQGRCELAMRLTTRNHALAEAVRPTRYLWWSRSSAGPERVEVVKIRDLGPRKLEVRLGLVEKERLRYYKGDFEPPPDGGEVFEPLEDGVPHPRMRLRRQRSLPAGRLLDPLGFVAGARWHRYEQGPFSAPVLYKDELRDYRARLLARTSVKVGDRRLPALAVHFSRSRPGAARREGFMRIWFSDDPRRLPLRFMIRGKVGALEVVLRPESLHAERPPATCRPSEAD